MAEVGLSARTHENEGALLERWRAQCGTTHQLYRNPQFAYFPGESQPGTSTPYRSDKTPRCSCCCFCRTLNSATLCRAVMTARSHAWTRGVQSGCSCAVRSPDPHTQSFGEGTDPTGRRLGRAERPVFAFSQRPGCRGSTRTARGPLTASSSNSKATSSPIANAWKDAGLLTSLRWKNTSRPFGSRMKP